MVVDAKATETSFDAAIHNLRPLIEYTKHQHLRQKGYNDVFTDLVISKAFNQDPQTLMSISREFQSEAKVPCCFMAESVLRAFVGFLRERPNLRLGINWRRLFAGGPVTIKEFDSDTAGLITERY
jgi:hypothetical protein